MENQPENQFYHDGVVTVTQSRFVTQSKTYAMRNISSVHIFEIQKSRVGPIIMILLGFPFLFSGEIFWMGLIIIALAILWLFYIKNEYAVRISTNSGEANSILSKDRVYIQKIVDALNDAIIYRG
ncbi:hypothetical protein EG349_13450 [Chryseobacterium shandongense]|uniref:QacE n=1 Tax=Chryseobacterium shandongense TaxID=1493872 RepID=A0A3G6R077_9FLAO|nr:MULTISPECIES: DUF6232 family protein [Chryseobacterium]AZA55799.1 hypothetical protein EG350_00645 [Chryseobacterium shandongense]AZA87728.1 hypothetical protein EG349_13450 [Chryseobacterium shandongense]AZA96226.1 hypothetical protein EG353_11910 [Chryseobacterium shandongense]